VVTATVQLQAKCKLYTHINSKHLQTTRNISKQPTSTCRTCMITHITQHFKETEPILLAWTIGQISVASNYVPQESMHKPNCALSLLLTKSCHVLSEESRLSHVNSKLDAGMHVGAGLALARRHAHTPWPTPKELEIGSRTLWTWYLHDTSWYMIKTWLWPLSSDQQNMNKFDVSMTDHDSIGTFLPDMLESFSTAGPWWQARIERWQPKDG